MPPIGAAQPDVARPELPVLQAHSYRMAGKIRPLLFWIGRDRVGAGLIVWRGAEGALAYELLIGTDPATAPRAINRWGYITEDVRTSGTRVFGVMTTSEEVTLSQVRQQIDNGQVHGRFKAIDARVGSGSTCATTGTIETERDLTLHDVSDLVRQVRARLTTVAATDAFVPAGVRPGFLTAVAELMTASVAARHDGPGALARLRGRSVPYVYGRNVLDLVVTEVTALSTPAGGPATPGEWPLHAEFEARARSSNDRYHFEVDYATEGPRAGVPLLIRYQPRWWLQVELTLDTDQSRVANLQRASQLTAVSTNPVR